MQDHRYCYANSNILKNKLNIRDRSDLFEAEKELTAIRLSELEAHPIEGHFDFDHLKAIHKYIFQDLYEWAGEERTVEISKGNLFCTTACLQSYAEAVFRKYFPQCDAAKNDVDSFVHVLAENYGDLNALHPFREGNGRAQREFARLVCMECGYDFDLSVTTHASMLEASKLSFEKGDSTGLVRIFSKAVTNLLDVSHKDCDGLKILTSDDLVIDISSDYCCSYNEPEDLDTYCKIYLAKINGMDK